MNRAAKRVTSTPRTDHEIADETKTLSIKNPIFLCKKI